MKSTITWMKLFPILFGFFVMGFVDVVGIATNYVKKDFFLSDTLANLIPMLVFLWFALCSIPTGMIMNKLGRKNTVLLSMGVTAVAMLLPLIDYNFSLTLLTFALLGIGNTILQVSLNPMIAQVVSEKKMASILTLGQFVKAISSFLGPVIAGIAASYWGNWKLIFVVYAGTTLLAGIWLLLSIDTDRPQNVKTTTSFRSALALFSDKIILWLFIGILAVVGIDVGLNTHIPKLLMAQTGLSLNEAGLAIRVIGEITEEKLSILRDADAIFREEMKLAGLDRTTSQFFAVLTDLRSVGVMGDERTYDYTLALRAVQSQDFMTATWSRLPYELLDKVSGRIVGEVKHINRICYDITSKPPATVEWE